MKNKMFLTLAALVLSAGSIFAYANLKETETASKKSCTEKCQPHCCDNDSATCGPADCKK